MKNFFAFTATATIILVVVYMTNYVAGTEWENARRHCKQSWGVTDEDLRRGTNNPGSNKVACCVACVYKVLKIMETNGNWNINNLIAKVTPGHTSAKEWANDCAKTKIQGDMCASAVALQNCYRKKVLG